MPSVASHLCYYGGTLFNQAIINNAEYSGHTMANMHKRISAYADDTLAHIANYNDVQIIRHTLDEFKKATSLEVQPRKCELVSTTKFTDYWSHEILDKDNILLISGVNPSNI